MYFRPFIPGGYYSTYNDRLGGPPCWSVHPPLKAVSPGHSDELRLGTLPTTGAFGTQKRRRETTLGLAKFGDGRYPSLADISSPFPHYLNGVLWIWPNWCKISIDFLQHYIVSMDLTVLSGFDGAWARCVWIELIFTGFSSKSMCVCICWWYM